MPSRSTILERIHSALRTATPQPPPPGDGALFDPISPLELLPRFESELLALNGEFFRAVDWQHAHDWVKRLAEKHELRRIVTAPVADAMEAGRVIQSRALSGDKDCGKNLAEVDLGITVCDCLIARTGTVVLTAQSGFGRALSILPPAHLVVARRSQLVGDLSDAFHLLYARYHQSWPSMITFITGPSRTSDIEKILILGAHGPKKLAVLLLDFES